jgi:hypothetical protein
MKQEAHKNKERAMGEEQQAAKRQMMELMQAGRSWQEAARIAGVQTSRSTAYRWWQAYRTRGEIALHDSRHGHSSKVRESVLHWSSPGAARHHRPLAGSSRRIFKSGSGSSSVSRILIVFERHAAWPDKPFEGKKTYAPSFSSEPYWQEGAGGLLLVVAESRDKVALTLGNGDTPSVNGCSLTQAVSCSGLSSQIVAHPAPA